MSRIRILRYLSVLTGITMLLAGCSPKEHEAIVATIGNKPVTLKGAITKVEWTNPHVYFYIDVKDDSGNVVNWAIESGAPNGLYRNGWRKDSLKIGDIVTVTGFLAKDGSHLANARTVTLPDGSRVFAGSANDQAPPPAR